MSAECSDCGCNLIYGNNYPEFECQYCKLQEELQELKTFARDVLRIVIHINEDFFEVRELEIKVSDFIQKHGTLIEEVLRSKG